jgi:hypothetical protein
METCFDPKTSLRKQVYGKQVSIKILEIDNKEFFTLYLNLGKRLRKYQYVNLISIKYSESHGLAE